MDCGEGPDTGPLPVRVVLDPRATSLVRSWVVLGERPGVGGGGLQAASAAGAVGVVDVCLRAALCSTHVARRTTHACFREAVRPERAGVAVVTVEGLAGVEATGSALLPLQLKPSEQPPRSPSIGTAAQSSNAAAGTLAVRSSAIADVVELLLHEQEGVCGGGVGCGVLEKVCLRGS